MATITKGFTFSAGATIVASEHNNNFDILYSDYNGNIQNVNFSASAAIVDSKLAQLTTASKVSNTALTVASHTNGDLFFYSGTNLWTRFARGTASQSLKCQHDTGTSLLLHFDNTITDSSITVHTSTNTGVTFSTVYKKFGTHSAQFSGTAYITIPDHADWNFGSGNLSIDFWIRFDVLGENYYGIVGQYVDISNWWMLQYDNRTGEKHVDLYNKSGDSYTVNIASAANDFNLSTGTWYHIAVSRSGNNFYMFLDGVLVHSQTSSGTMSNFNAVLNIGAADDGVSAAALNGWLDEVRISKNIIRWATTFTPETSAYIPELKWVT